MRAKNFKPFSRYRLVLFFLAAFLIPFLFKAVNQAQSASVVVILNDKGFSKDFLSVRKNTTVIWKIEGEKEHWPASNFHPTHTEYPQKGGCIGSQLDACRGLKSGESYSFKFDKSGSWGIHDHLFPGFTMNVKVGQDEKRAEFVQMPEFLDVFKVKENEEFDLSIDPEKHARAVREYCNDNSNYKDQIKGKNKLACFAEQFKNLAYKYGQKNSHKILFSLQQMDPEAKNCHFIAHGIGWGVYAKNPKDWQNSISQSSSQCSYGEQMGIIEEYTQNLPDGKIHKDDVENICGFNPQADCNHAVGHMMLVLEKNNLDKATELCSAISDRRQRFICFHGMIMEKMVGGNLREHGIIPKSDTNWPSKTPEYEKFCGSLTGDLQLACWREIVHPALHYYEKNPRLLFDLCNRAPNKEARDLCKVHSIPEIEGWADYDLESTRKMCTLDKEIDPEFEKVCYENMVSIKLNFVNLKDASDVVHFCASLSDEFKLSCFNSIGIALNSKGIHEEDRRKFCKNAPEEYMKYCAIGVREMQND